VKPEEIALISRIEESLKELRTAMNCDGFIDPCDTSDIIQRTTALSNEISSISSGFLYRIGLGNRAIKEKEKELSLESDRFLKEWQEHNHILALSVVSSVSEIINPVGGSTLDPQQMESIVTDVSTRLVIAGAGTGKTTTILGLVKYLISQGTYPDSILLLSYTNASADELKMRIRRETHNEVPAMTVHSLAMSILRESSGISPTVHDRNIRGDVKDIVERLSSDPKSRFRSDLAYYLARYIGNLDPKGNNIASAYKRTESFHTLQGFRVKSIGEVEIANYLFLHGIPYRYEDDYKVDTSDEEHGRYRPDFHILGTDVYIELFGIDRSGNVSPEIEERDPGTSKKYRESMEWKRRIHRENGTKLIELFSYQRAENDMLAILEKALSENGISPIPLDLFQQEDRTASRILDLAVSELSSMLTLIRESWKTFDQSFPSDSTDELTAIRRILRPVYGEYARMLSSEGTIDFSDMVRMAHDAVTDGRYTHKFEYVIVDEYQDMSASRYRLLKALRDSRRYRLFCVGDDWQSIYRFNGSDISYITDFERYWGPSAVFRIEHTYRFTGELLRASSEFIMSNKEQIRKELVGPEGESALVLIDEGLHDESVKKLADIMCKFRENSSVLILGRYWFDAARLDCRFQWHQVAGGGYIRVEFPERPDLDVRFMTIHGSKGLQADYVAILNNTYGGYGFPSTRKENPVLSGILESRNDNLQEERRLMYVALTRARKGAYVLTEYGSESVFVRELFPERMARLDATRCPNCGGKLVPREGPYGKFYGCSNYNKGCTYKCKALPEPVDKGAVQDPEYDRIMYRRCRLVHLSTHDLYPPSNLHPSRVFRDITSKIP
jgi:DNA helicase-4